MSELTPEAKAEIEAAVKIVASDKGYQHLTAIKRHLIPDTPETADPPADGEPTAPPKKDKTPAEEKPKVGLWGVGRADDDS